MRVIMISLHVAAREYIAAAQVISVNHSDSASKREHNLILLCRDDLDSGVLLE
jgi:hypothetical protein